MSVARQARRRWLGPLGFAAGATAAGAALAVNLTIADFVPGNSWSVGYGVAATALLLLAAGYGARRRMMRTASRWRGGSASGWLALHLWGGGLFLVLVLMHSGFRLPSGQVTGWLWVLSWWTVLSGLVGRLLQRWIPRLLASGLSTEVLYERIPELVADLRERAARAVDGAHESVVALWERRLADELAAPRRRALYFVDITGGAARRLKPFRYLQRLLAEDDRERLAELERLYRAKLEIDAQYTLQSALRWWLYLHVPTSIVLLALLAVHLYAVWAY